MATRDTRALARSVAPFRAAGLARAVTPPSRWVRDS